MKAVVLVLLACVLILAPMAQAQRTGVISDSSGFVDVQAEKNGDAAVIATVKAGEPFTFERAGDGDWCKVTLASGKSGSMSLSYIRLHFTEKDLPSLKKDPAGESEIDQFARGRGLNYAAVTRRAARGNGKALKQSSNRYTPCLAAIGSLRPSQQRVKQRSLGNPAKIDHEHRELADRWRSSHLSETTRHW